jgi:excisionase family DNA binding protein
VRKDNQNDDEQLSTTEAGERLGVSRKRIHQLIEEGKLPARKVGNVWIIEAKNLPLVQNRLSVGRPKKSSTTPATGAEDEKEDE